MEGRRGGREEEGGVKGREGWSHVRERGREKGDSPSRIPRGGEGGRRRFHAAMNGRDRLLHWLVVCHGYVLYSHSPQKHKCTH